MPSNMAPILRAPTKRTELILCIRVNVAHLLGSKVRAHPAKAEPAYHRSRIKARQPLTWASKTVKTQHIYIYVYIYICMYIYIYIYTYYDNM